MYAIVRSLGPGGRSKTTRAPFPLLLSVPCFARRRLPFSPLSHRHVAVSRTAFLASPRRVGSFARDVRFFPLEISIVAITLRVRVLEYCRDISKRGTLFLPRKSSFSFLFSLFSTAHSLTIASHRIARNRHSVIEAPRPRRSSNAAATNA